MFIFVLEKSKLLSMSHCIIGELDVPWDDDTFVDEDDPAPPPPPPPVIGPMTGVGTTINTGAILVSRRYTIGARDPRESCPE
jgi:hypothetical protein